MFKVFQDTKNWKSKFITKEELEYLNTNTKSVNVYGWENLNNKEKMSITSVINKL
jgi:hypothetical protein